MNTIKILTDKQEQDLKSKERLFKSIKAYGKRRMLWYRKVYIKSFHWKKLRKRKLQEKNCCEHCGSKNNLQVHHIRYKYIFNVTLKDLLTLCVQCHEKEHVRLNKLKKLKKGNYVTK